jgi:hypothetical protein
MMMDRADAVTVVRRSLDGYGAEHGQGEGGSDQFVHDRVLRSANQSNAGQLMSGSADPERRTCNRHQAG